MYPPVEGGIERTIFHLTRLTKEAFDPSVIVASLSSHPSTREVDGGVQVVEVPSYGRLLSTPVAPGFAAAMRESKADLFHFHFPHPTGEVAYLLSGLKTPSVVTYHSDVVRQKAALRLYRPFQERFLACMDVIMPTSRRYLETSEALAPLVDRCLVVPLGLPLEDYELSEEGEARALEFRRQWGGFVLFLGRLRYYKGLAFLIEAAKSLPGTHIVIAGEGKERLALEEQTYALGLEERVHFLGDVDQAKAVALLHSAAVFCLPAHQRSEAFGLCQVEAMACKLPIVSTDLPTGVPEVNRHEETGLIVPPADSEALTHALHCLLADRPLREKLGAAGRRRAELLYTASRMAEQVSEIYWSVLGG